MDFTPAEFPNHWAFLKKNFIDKMIALAKAGDDAMEHLKCVFYTWAVFYEADEETTSGIAEFLANAAEHWGERRIYQKSDLHFIRIRTSGQCRGGRSFPPVTCSYKKIPV